MDPSYVNVMDMSDSVWMFIAYVIHTVAMVVQVGLVCFLALSGVHNAFLPERDGAWIRRLGAADIGASGARARGWLRIALALLLLAPLLLGAHYAVSLVAALGALSLLVLAERGIPAEAKRPGRLARRVAIAGAGFAALFSVWEREDGLALGVDLARKAGEWRSHEVAWQQENDVRSPKVGDLAPDFELQDPEGRAVVRLSEFRGERPVALVFGSYT